MKYKLFGMMLFAMIFGFTLSTSAQDHEHEVHERPERAEKVERPERADKECNGREIHERTEHNIVERIAEKAIPNLEKVHEKTLERNCEMDKARPDPKPSKDLSDRKFDKNN